MIIKAPYRVPLTDRQEEAFHYICLYKSLHDGNSPSIRQLADALRLASVSSVYQLLVQLHDRGWITIEDGRTRSIQVVGATWSVPPDYAL